jgi:hypothetical protein
VERLFWIGIDRLAVEEDADILAGLGEEICDPGGVAQGGFSPPVGGTDNAVAGDAPAPEAGDNVVTDLGHGAIPSLPHAVTLVRRNGERATSVPQQ